MVGGLGEVSRQQTHAAAIEMIMEVAKVRPAIECSAIRHLQVIKRSKHPPRGHDAMP